MINDSGGVCSCVRGAVSDWTERVFSNAAQIRRLRDENAKLLEERDAAILRAEGMDHYRIKAKCYGDMVHGVSPALAEAGFPVEEFTKDGNVGAVRRSVERLKTAYDSVRFENAKLRRILKDSLSMEQRSIMVSPGNWERRFRVGIKDKDWYATEDAAIDAALRKP